ncbi:MAG: hypothetical protein WDN44_11020 [Sphingomonas sp.]
MGPAMDMDQRGMLAGPRRTEELGMDLDPSSAWRTIRSGMIAPRSRGGS